MNRKTYRPSRAAQYRRGAARYRAGGAGGRREEGPRLGAILLLGLLILAVYLRFSPGETPQAVRQAVSSLLSGDMDLKEAVTVFGRKAAGEGEEALLTFGRKLLGQGGEEQSDPGAEEYQIPAEQEIHQISPEQMNWKEAAGNASGRLFLSAQGLEGLCESPYPAFDFSCLRFDLPEEELLDDTPNEEFVIPSPDVVDDGVYSLSFPCAAPLQGRITSSYGYRDHPIDEEVKFHYGVDIAAARGTPIGSFAAGTVTDTGRGTVYGNFVRVDHGDGFTSFYGHMDSISVTKGQKVALGQQVGKVGSTGKSTGPHLHFEMRKDGKIINPNDYVELAA